jgi:dihydroxyacid dehydratase/phosphogluconate dehydratase
MEVNPVADFNPNPKEMSSVYSGDDPLSMIRRTWLYATGMTYDEIKKPFVAVANTYAEMHPATSTSARWLIR